MLSLFATIALLALDQTLVKADPTDFVSPKYVLQPARDSTTNSAKATIQRNAQNAQTTFQKGRPWSVTNSNGVVAPSGDKHDFLSWAPYHWPNCNWCPSGRTHLVHSGDGNATDHDSDPPPPYTDLGPGEDVGDSDDSDYAQRSLHDDSHFPSRHRRIIRSRRSLFISSESSPSSTQSLLSSEETVLDALPLPQAPLGSTPLPAVATPVVSLPTPGSHTTSQHVAGSSAPQAAVKTQKAKPSKSSCTPSPTTSMPPSATWTTCPYVLRDGKVNPDVRELVAAGAINKAADGCLSNTLAFIFSNDREHCKTAINIITAFFLDKATKMNPHMKFGQLVRGPGKSDGTFTGVLDMRGMVKIANSILILREARAPDWTADLDQAMRVWTKQYVEWLEKSAIGQKASSRPNNHGTFFAGQLAGLYMSLKQPQDALRVMDKFFNTQFQDQIAKSGEQPFEAVRTRPFHYRSFNLEGLIVLAKLGDQLGRNYWEVKGKHGATIKNAVDFLLKTDPGKESSDELVPHVAAAIAAYGSSQAYSNFMRQHRGFENKPFYFYDQHSALSNAPSSKSSNRRSVVWGREEDEVTVPVSDSDCPVSIFKELNETRVEIDNGLFVTCQELLPLYDLVK